ncbi:FkbM family methyltransferase [Lysobacter sp.]|uniref:FkbM family methyltransferase n=1 Tax=Lysobacter sp. TaxID=72226 RepID=UPI002D4AF473|nr:FkbM family methyltransferase [Lysobacter sp.]HZX77228.1 FkbM family methyltransferase [Lysobacter sp.]
MSPEHILALRKAARRASLGGRFLLPLRVLRRMFNGSPGTIRIDDFDGDLSLTLRISEHMQGRIFWMGYYNREVVATLNQLLKPGMTFLDIGANIGELSIVAARRVGPHGKVIAFEPLPQHADRLQMHLQANAIGWASVERLALADRAGELTMYVPSASAGAPGENFGLGTLYGSGSDAPIGTVPVTSLDEYLDQHPISRIDFIKIDVEGAELPCLVGARRMIARHLPHLIVEVQVASARAAGYEQSAILDELRAHGYTFRRITLAGAGDPIDEGTLGEYQNVLCVPPSQAPAYNR